MSVLQNSVPNTDGKTSSLPWSPRLCAPVGEWVWAVWQAQEGRAVEEAVQGPWLPGSAVCCWPGCCVNLVNSQKPDSLSLTCFVTVVWPQWTKSQSISEGRCVSVTETLELCVRASRLWGSWQAGPLETGDRYCCWPLGDCRHLRRRGEGWVALTAQA